MSARNKKSFVDLTVDDDEDEDIIITAVVKKSRACSGEIVDLLENDDGIDKDSMELLPAYVTSTSKADDWLVAQLSAQWTKEDRQREHYKRTTEVAMKKSIPGKAVSMVQNIIELANKTRIKFPQFHRALETIGTDDRRHGVFG